MTTYKNIIRWAMASLSFAIVLLILWNTYDFFQRFKNEERQKMEVLSEAYKRFSSAGLNEDITLSSKIISGNTNIPMIVTDANDSILNNQNLDSLKTQKPNYLKEQLALMKSQNEPLVVSYQQGAINVKRFVYYKDSDLLTKLKYYPLALIFILLLFGIVIYLVFKSNKSAEQNKLWAGMAKETAHQIGTPLTSLLGWVELLKQQHIASNIISEIERDIARLSIIANRFSNIGSIPKLQKVDLIKEIRVIEDYFKTRIPKGISFSVNYPAKDFINASVNQQLFSWVLENLIKNAIDALKSNGCINIDLEESPKNVYITVTDTGKGIPKKNFKPIFKPGYTTKKRGWGLGLSLAKRIIENYHDGKIYVLKSEINKGTSLRVELPKLR
ncbi:MAG: HAMP domain-containing histidine kinase [Flavobacteriaceae bacterium]|nr:HAMP domain-containing histidine kinase [Flavobacteriaceae bacterium]